MLLERRFEFQSLPIFLHLHLLKLRTSDLPKTVEYTAVFQFGRKIRKYCKNWLIFHTIPVIIKISLKYSLKTGSNFKNPSLKNQMCMLFVQNINRHYNSIKIRNV